MTLSPRSGGASNVHGVYFDDLDAYRILHNARYLLLFERTIGSFWQRLGWGHSLELDDAPDSMHYVRANHIEYHRPVTGVTEVRVRVWIEKVGETSLTFAFCVMPMDEDTDFATGKRVLVRVDGETKRPTRWSDAFRAKVAPWVRKSAAT